MVLQRAGHQVPAFFTVTASAFRCAMRDIGMLERIASLGDLEDEQTIYDAATSISTDSKSW